MGLGMIGMLGGLAAGRAPTVNDMEMIAHDLDLATPSTNYQQIGLDLEKRANAAAHKWVRQETTQLIKKYNMGKKGWHKEPARHSLAARGVKTGRSRRR